MKKINVDADNKVAEKVPMKKNRAAVLLDLQLRDTSMDDPSINIPNQTFENNDPSLSTKSIASQRLSWRKALFEKRRRISDYASIFSMFGLVIMIIEDELTSAGVYTKASYYSTTLKTSISISTVILLCFVLAHHYVQVQLFLIDNCADDWRVAMTWQRIVQVLAELTICAIHPIPGEYYFWEKTKITSRGSDVVMKKVSYDIMLSLPMFLRLFLVCRTMLLHSNTFSDTTSRSVGAMNRINFNMKFVLKTLLHIYPGTVLLVFIISFWIIASWTLRQCERFHGEEHADFFDAIWVIVITFLTIGYGDIVPNTYCGRSIAVLTGIMSTGCTALLVAVISQKLELTKAEKDVNDFMMQTQLAKKKKEAAAKVLCETWMIYKYTHLVKTSERERLRAHQRRFLSAVHVLRKVRTELQKFTTGANASMDFPKAACMLDKRMASIEDKLDTLQTRMEIMPEALTHGVVRHLESRKLDTNSS